jgi:two-component system, OmpR family, response regulator
MQKILIVEDDKAIAESLKLYLGNSNFEVFLYHSWEGAVDEVMNINPDLLILDINLPGKDGIEICKELRLDSDLSIIMLTARNSELDKITWLEIWADDYIAKPFSPRELLARINTILRRIDNKKDTDSNTLVFRNVVLDLDKKMVFVDKKEVFLTGNEFDLLKRIVEEDWKLISREVLMSEVMWYDNYIYDRTLDTHIKNLRKKLWKKDIILTIRWEWYRLNT